MNSLQASSKPVVLHVRVNAGAGGGVDKTVLNSPRFLDRFGYEGHCAYLRAPENQSFEYLRQRAARLAAPLHVVDDRGPFDLSVYKRMTSICRKLDVRVWHGHEYKSNLAGVLARRRHSMRMVTTAHGWVDRHGLTPLYYAIDRLCLRFYEKILCVSSDLMKKCRRAGLPGEKLVQIDNAIDSEAYSAKLSRRAAKMKLGYDADQILVGSLGRLSTEKGYDLLIEAFTRVARDYSGLQLLVAGIGPEQQRLQELAEQSDAAIRFLGFCDDTVLLYNALDIFVSSSRREGMPNVLLEAMSMELPIVATRIAGVPDLILDGETGLLVESEQVRELELAIRNLLESRELRDRIGAAARRRIEDRFQFEDRIKKITSIYDALLV